MKLAEPQQVVLRGLLGEAVYANYQGRLKHFIKGVDSDPIAMFGPEAMAKNFGSSWYGEHAGKWMYAASRAAARTRDADLATAVRNVADFLVSRQEPSGYLGTYAPGSPSRMTYQDRPRRKTWDVWVHSYIILGLLEVNRFYPNEKYLRTACRVGDLCYDLFVSQGRSIADWGSHLGLSATILLEPAVELYRATGEKRYLELAIRVVDQVEERPTLALLSRSLKGEDLQEMGDGKIYQLLWNFVALAKLFEVTGRHDYKRAAEHAWTNVAEHHLTPAGGPWGGVGGESFERFSAKDYFSPYGTVETCSTMSWIHLNRDLLRLTGEAKYADEIEKTLYNSLLGAQDPNGEDWAYFIFTNGQRSHTYYWACCKSSGAVALEEIAPIAFATREGGIAVNLYSPSEARIELADRGIVALALDTDYPRSDEIRLTVNPTRQAAFPLFLRIPRWAEGVEVSVDGDPLKAATTPGTYLRIERTWHGGNRVTARFPMKLRIVRTALSIMRDEDREINRIDYAAVVRGPLCYATGLIDGYKREETFKLPKASAEARFSQCPTPAGAHGPAFQLKLPGREPVVFLPYYEAGGRAPGRWRATWFCVAWE